MFPTREMHYFQGCVAHCVDVLLEDLGEKMSCEPPKNDYFIHLDTPHGFLM